MTVDMIQMKLVKLTRATTKT